MKEQPFKIPRSITGYLLLFLSLISSLVFCIEVLDNGFYEKNWLAWISAFVMIAGVSHAFDFFVQRQIAILKNELYHILIRYPRWIYLQGYRFKLDHEMFKMHNLQYQRYIWLRQKDLREVAVAVKRRIIDE